MPGTIQEKVAFARMLLAGELMPDTAPVWADGTRATAEEIRDLEAVMLYEIRLQAVLRRKARQRPARLRALALLRSFLDEGQRAQLARNRHFDYVTPSGRRYRFWPHVGTVNEVERHRTRWFPKQRFCIHPEDDREIPPADTTLAQLLTLVESEERFLRTANAHPVQLWDGEWLRILARRRRVRREAEAACRAAGFDAVIPDAAIDHFTGEDPYDAWLEAR